MWGRIRDVVYLLIFGYSSTERRCRELEQDLHSIFEKLNLLMAREAKRESRQARARLAELESGVVSPATPSDRKAALRSRVFGHLRPPQLREAVEDEPGDTISESSG
jgi:hypothetical protein